LARHTQNTTVPSLIATTTSNLTAPCITGLFFLSDTNDCASKFSSKTSHSAAAFQDGRTVFLTNLQSLRLHRLSSYNVCDNVFSKMLIRAYIVPYLLAIFHLIGFYNMKQKYYQWELEGKLGSLYTIQARTVYLAIEIMKLDLLSLGKILWVR